MSKYDPLTHHLAARNEARIAMRFDEIERLLGFALPRSARLHRPWWANSGHGHVQAKGWLNAGYQSQEVDLEAERLEFVRLNRLDDVPAGLPAKGNHPLWGLFAGQVWVQPGYDLTEPADPNWGAAES